MKSFQKLALASAIAMSSFGAFAMQAMDDDSMSAATGQDGITMKIALPCYGAASCTAITDPHGISIDQVFVKDGDGFTAFDKALTIAAAGTPTNGTYVNPGYIYVDGLNIQTTSGTPITVMIDQSGNSGNTSGAVAGAANTDTPVLNVSVSVPKIDINVGAVYVTNDTTGGATSSGTHVATKIANAMSISTSGATNLNIQLGAQPQGAMILVSTTIAGGVTLTNAGVHDGVLGGDLNTGSITLLDAGGAALTVKAAVNIAASSYVIPGSGGLTLATSGVATHGALVLTLSQLGKAGVVGVAGGGLDVTLSNTTMGDLTGSAALGDVILKGVNLNGTQVLVYGH